MSVSEGEFVLKMETYQRKFLDTAEVEGHLKTRALRGGVYTLVSQVGNNLIRMISLMTLGRILTPADYGTVAMITAITGFIMLFSDLGLSHATIQRQKLTQAQVSNLFWVNLGLALAMMLVVMALAPVLVWFYKKPELLWLTIGSSIGFIFAGLTVQHQALMLRQLRFGLQVVIMIGSTTLGVAVGIGAAWLGAGAWSLVLIMLVDGLSRMIWVWSAFPWRPSRPSRGSGLISLLKFGGNLTGFNIVNYFARNLDHVLIGRVLGDYVLGLYSRAYELLLFPIRRITAPITSVAVASLSRVQNDPVRYRHYFLKTVYLIGLVTFPGVMYLINLSDVVIRVILGPRWAEAGVIFSIMGFSAIFQPVQNTWGWVLVSTGQTNRMFRWGIFSSAVCVISFIVGLPHGAKGVALSYTIAMLFLLVPSVWYAARRSPVSMGDFFGCLCRPLLATAVMGISLEFLNRGRANIIGMMRLEDFWRAHVLWGDLMVLGISFLLAAGIYLGCICLLARSTKPITELFDLARDVRHPIPAAAV